MGMDARVDIWVGAKLESGVDVNDIVTLSDEQKQELEEEGEVSADGMTIRLFSSCDERVGFGVELFSHDWDGGVVELDLIKLACDADKLIERVGKIFREWGYEKKPEVLLMTDFS